MCHKIIILFQCSMHLRLLGKSLGFCQHQGMQSFCFLYLYESKMYLRTCLGLHSTRGGLAFIPKFKHAHHPETTNTGPVSSRKWTKWPCLGVSVVFGEQLNVMANHSCLLQPNPRWGGIHPTASPWSARNCTARRVVQIISDVLLSLPS